MTTIKSYSDLLPFIHTSQITLQNLAAGRLRGPNGWQDIELDYKFKLQLAEDVTAVYGGRKREQLQKSIITALNGLSHWGFRRTFIEYHNKDFKIVYGPAQDYPYELNAIRRYLYGI